jgi:hypothetical protein
MSSEPVARVAELEAENEELYARLEAAERGSADTNAAREKNERLREAVAKARAEVAELRERRRELEGARMKKTNIRTAVLAFVLGIALGFFHAR